MKDLFDLALELNVKSYIKKTFAFDSSIIMSPSMIPRNILNKIIDDNVDYMKLKVTPKTKIYIESLEDLKIEIANAELQYIPSTFVDLPEDQAKDVLDLIERLEGDDDVQNVYHNLQ